MFHSISVVRVKERSAFTGHVHHTSYSALQSYNTMFQPILKGSPEATLCSLTLFIFRTPSRYLTLIFSRSLAPSFQRTHTQLHTLSILICLCQRWQLKPRSAGMTKLFVITGTLVDFMRVCVCTCVHVFCVCVTVCVCMHVCEIGRASCRERV